MTKRHCIAKNMFFQSFIFCFFFFLNVLLDETAFVVVEVLENELLVKGVLLLKGIGLSIIVQIYDWLLQIEFLDLDVILHGFLLDIFKGVVWLHKGKHRFSIKFRIPNVDFNKECDRHVVKHIFPFLQCVFREILEQLGFLSQMPMTFKMID